MLKKTLFFVNIISTYMPLVILPISAYVAFDNFFFAGITIVIWRLLTYYKYRILNFVLSFFITKIIIICLLITLSILTIDIYLKTIIVILLSSAIPIYFTLDNATIKVKRNIRVLLMITGMVISGFLIKIIIVANYYFICFTIFLLFAGKTKDFKKAKWSFINLYIFDVLNAFIHNFHYYIFAFLIPIIAYIYSGNYFMAGIACCISWILYLAKYLIINFLIKFLDLRKIIYIGFIITSILLIVIGLSTHILIIFICLLFQGASAGISEGFWELDRIKKSQSQFWKIWKLGGILGACLGSVLALFVGIDLLFIIAATMAFLGFIMNLFISLFQKGKKGY